MSSAHCFNNAVNQAREDLAAQRKRLESQHDKGSPGIQVCAGLADMLDGILNGHVEDRVARGVKQIYETFDVNVILHDEYLNSCPRISRKKSRTLAI